MIIKIETNYRLVNIIFKIMDKSSIYEKSKILEYIIIYLNEVYKEYPLSVYKKIHKINIESTIELLFREKNYKEYIKNIRNLNNISTQFKSSHRIINQFKSLLYTKTKSDDIVNSSLYLCQNIFIILYNTDGILKM